MDKSEGYFNIIFEEDNPFYKETISMQRISNKSALHSLSRQFDDENLSSTAKA